MPRNLALLAVVAVVALTACLPDQTRRHVSMASYAPSRTPGYALDGGLETAELTRLLEARAPGLRMLEFSVMTRVSLSEVGLLFVTAGGGRQQGPDPQIDLVEREVFRDFVLDGGHLVLLLDSPGFPGVFEMTDLVRRLGLDVVGGLSGPVRVRLQDDTATGLRDGGCGPVREVTIRDSAVLQLGPGWRPVAWAATDLVAAYLPAGIASPRAGSIFVLGSTTGIRTQGGDAATRVLVCNAIMNGLEQISGQ